MTLQKKICVIGPPAVGKTSLVSRFVRNFFTDRYLSTIGVRIDRKQLAVGGQELSLVIWDLAGELELGPIAASYLRGASGCLLVLDGTRRASLDQALELRTAVRRIVGDVPLVVVVNKSDLERGWQVHPGDLAGLDVLFTSAKSGEGVPEAFARLAEQVVQREPAAPTRNR